MKIMNGEGGRLFMKTKEKLMMYGGWLLSLSVILAGAYFIWPRIHKLVRNCINLFRD